jgi:hypothetical protein
MLGALRWLSMCVLLPRCSTRFGAPARLDALRCARAAGGCGEQLQVEDLVDSSKLHFKLHSKF